MNRYLKPERDVGKVPTFVPVPAEFRGVLEGLFCVDVEPHVGIGVFWSGVGKNDSGGQTPYDTFLTGFINLECAFDLGPVPVGLVLLGSFGYPLLHGSIKSNQL